MISDPGTIDCAIIVPSNTLYQHTIVTRYSNTVETHYNISDAVTTTMHDTAY